MAGAPPPDLVDRAYRVGDAALPAPVPPAGVRRTAIRTFGIVQIVLGGLSSLGALIAFINLMDSPSAAGWTDGFLIYAVPAANLLFTGIGSVSLASWARRATLISAAVWLALLVFLAFAAWRFRLFASAGYEAVLLAAFVALGLTLAVALIAFYTRPSVRATFERRTV